MSLDRFLTTEVTVLTPAVQTNRYGDAVADWANATSRCVMGWLHQRATAETLKHRDATVAEDVLFLPDDDPIGALDRVLVNGSSYDVDGVPLVASTPDGPHHVEVNLRRVAG